MTRTLFFFRAGLFDFKERRPDGGTKRKLRLRRKTDLVLSVENLENFQSLE